MELKPAERKKVVLDLKISDFSFYDDSSHSWIVEPGTFNILIGSSSRDIRLDAKLEFLG